jgi:hypothetical protein
MVILRKCNLTEYTPSVGEKFPWVCGWCKDRWSLYWQITRGAKQYGKFWDMVEASVSTMGCRRLLRFRPSMTGCIHVGVNKN